MKKRTHSNRFVSEWFRGKRKEMRIKKMTNILLVDIFCTEALCGQRTNLVDR